MIKSALEYIIGLKKPETIEIDGRTFINGGYHPVLSPYNATVNLHTLTGLVDIIKKEYGGENLVINIKSHTEVEVVSCVYGGEMQRDTHYTVTAILPSLNFGRSMEMESFIIELQSKFMPDENRNNLLNFASRVRFDDNQEIYDNGVSQMVTVKTGVAKLENTQTPNPVKLRPFRTFHNVEQPASDFIFRIDKNRGFMLVEADGGAWKNEAMQNIKAYLQEAFKDFPDITVVA